MSLVQTKEIKIRINKQEEERLEAMKAASGIRHSTTFIRNVIFGSDYAIHSKINKILELLEQNEVNKK